MPKIPTFTSKTEMTTSSPHVKSNIQIDPGSNIYNVTKPLQNFLVNEYVKEKKLEADNKSTLILSDLYINQENGTKGLYTIQSETSSNGNPTDAANFFDENVNKLWSYAEATKISDLDNFTKKALEKKFYATAGMFKVKALEGSRNEQFKITKKITDDFVMKDALALKLNGIDYLDIYKNNVLSRIEQDTTLKDAGVKKKQAELYLKFGQNTLANSLASSQPEFLKENIDKFDALNVDEKLKLIAAADTQILENNKQYFTTSLNLNEDSTASQLVNNYQEIVNGTFGGNVELIKEWEKLPPSDKAAIIKFARTKRRENTAEINNRQTAILKEQQQKAVNDYQKMFNDTNFLETIDLLKINQVFGEPTNAYELDSKTQMVELATKIGQKEFNNVNDYYKNFQIQKKILSGEITDHITKFTLPGETEAKSITDRVGEGISKSEFGFYLNYLLNPNLQNPEFIKNNKKLYKKIELLQPSIEGDSSLKYIDTTTDNRLNNFQSQMILRFNEGIRNGINIDELLDKTSKHYIGKGLIEQYKANKDAITEILANKSAEVSGDNQSTIPLYSEEKYGSVDGWLNSRDYLEWKFPGKKKLREDIESVAEETTQEEFDKGLLHLQDGVETKREAFQSSNQGITYKGKLYKYNEDGSPPKEFLEELEKDSKNKNIKASKINFVTDIILGKDRDVINNWNEHYQTDNTFENAVKAKRLLKLMEKPGYKIPDDAIQAILIAATNFANDGGFSKETLIDYLTKIGQIETQYKTKRQRGDNPERENFYARSYWQIEVDTAKDLLKNSSAIFGNNFETSFSEEYAKDGKTARESLLNLDDKDLVELLEKDDALAANFAAALIVTRFNSKTA